MTEPLDRDEVIRLLDRLGSEQDADVLQAARDLHAQINAADMDWDELLMPDASTEPEENEDEDEDEDDSDLEDTEASSPAVAKGKNDDTLALIETLLAKPGRSDALREELEEYKTDIANGEFAARDYKYVRALYDRLTK